MVLRVLRWSPVILGSLLLPMVLYGCMRPTGFQVREGGDASNADDDVAYRTTYYFRVFDPCAIERRQKAILTQRANGSLSIEDSLRQPLNDTIYRFIMTGKASTLLSNIRFESGFLKVSEIDPFGATVEYDKDLDRFVFESAEDVEARLERKIALESFEELKQLYIEMLPKDQALGSQAGLDDVRVRLSAALAEFIGEYMRRFTPAAPGDAAPESAAAPLIPPVSVNAKPEGDGKIRLSFSVLSPTQTEQQFEVLIEENADGELIAKVAPPGVKTLGVEKPSLVECYEGGIPTRRGFQILGPEGWRTFDQDERLLLVMSADGQPLIGTLKELSQRILRSHSAELAYRLPLAEERLSVAQANDQLDTRSDEDTPAELLNRAIRAFGVTAESTTTENDAEASPTGESTGSSQ